MSEDAGIVVGDAPVFQAFAGTPRDTVTPTGPATAYDAATSGSQWTIVKDGAVVANVTPVDGVMPQVLIDIQSDPDGAELWWDFGSGDRVQANRTWLDQRVVTLESSVVTLEGSAPTASYFDEVMADVPLAYYRLGETSGTVVADSSGNARHGAYTGTPTLGVTGAIVGDSNLAFSSVNNGRAETSSSAALQLSSFVHEFWCKGVANEGTWFWARAGSANWALRWSSSGPVIVAKVSGDTYTFSFSGSLNDANWHHIAIRATASVVEVFFDGVSLTAQSRTTVTAINSTMLLCYDPVSTNSQTGQFDEWAIYTTLSDARILAHYNAGIAA